MSDITPLREVTPDEAYQRDVVLLLEEFLAQAKRGEFSGVLILGELAGTTRMQTGYTGARSVVERLGALEVLRYEWLKAWSNNS